MGQRGLLAKSGVSYTSVIATKTYQNLGNLHPQARMVVAAAQAHKVSRLAGEGKRLEHRTSE